ncbi:MAG: fibronectin type III domain-containing protein [Lachnospiraceae bacterium]|nr:fibronectin type III domain-containing protein [Lachnospiraceae bacterium]
MLKAINGNDESAYTATSSCRFLAKTSVSAVNTGTGIKLSWTKITGAANYQICRRELVDGVWSAWKTITYATGTSYTDTSVQDGVTYSYIIRAKNSWALGAFTSTPGIKH